MFRAGKKFVFPLFSSYFNFQIVSYISWNKFFVLPFLNLFVLPDELLRKIAQLEKSEETSLQRLKDVEKERELILVSMLN